MVAWKLETLETLDEKPGKLWTEEEFACVCAWWQEPKQLRLLWHYAARYLGSMASREDVEDAVVDFFPLLERARLSFKPTGMTFFTYAVCVCFKHQCARSAQRIQRRRREEVPFQRDSADGEGFMLELRDDTGSHDPVIRTQNGAFVADLSAFLAGNKLSEVQKRAFILRFIEGMSYEEVAAQLNAPLGSVKGWLHRATKSARVYLEKRGWG